MASPTNPLIEALRSPTAYRHSTGDVALLETHISWVLLTGDYAYKIKKPVDLGFVDFTTLKRREFFCREELRLNRRLAADLYLDVVPITGSPETPKMEGAGQPIEFAVQMRQFAQTALLSHVLKKGELTRNHIDALAGEIARFHAEIATSSPDTRFGSPDIIRKMNQAVFQALELRTADVDRVSALKDWCSNELISRGDRFARRKAQGFVRECHGDMHLGNMVLLAGKPVIFDCIEFNEELRWIDVISEVAFATMDLEDRGSAAFAHRLLNAYLEETGDYAALAVCRYYLVYRALVRAKVASLRAEQGLSMAEEREAVSAEYRGYLRIAERFTRPLKPWLAITHGPSGSGKSTVAQTIVEETGALRIRSDVERKRLLGLKPLDRTRDASTAYSAETTARTYERLTGLARLTIEAGFPAVVDGTFLMRSQRRLLQELSEQLGVRFYIFDFWASEETLRQRIAQRVQNLTDASEGDSAVLDRQLRARQPLGEDERGFAVFVSSDAPDDAVRAIRQ